MRRSDVADSDWLRNSAAGIPVAYVFGARQQRFLVLLVFQRRRASSRDRDKFFSADQLTEIGAAERIAAAIAVVPIKANLRMVAVPAK